MQDVRIQNVKKMQKHLMKLRESFANEYKLAISYQGVLQTQCSMSPEAIKHIEDVKETILQLFASEPLASEYDRLYTDVRAKFNEMSDDAFDLKYFVALGLLAACFGGTAKWILNIRNAEKIIESMVRYCKVRDDAYFKNNAYFRDINFDVSEDTGEIKTDTLTLTLDTVIKGSFYEGGTLNWDKSTGYLYSDYGVVLPEATFKLPFLQKKGVNFVWMSLTPNEIETMVEPIAKAKGKVLTYGLGLGYYTYMTAIKEDVTSVTVVERDTEVIKLFNEHILPKFKPKARAKVKIIQADMFDHFFNLTDGEYDTIFVDTWYTLRDGAACYVPLKCYDTVNFSKTKVDYWIENSIREALVSNIIQSHFLSYIGDIDITNKSYEELSKLTLLEHSRNAKAEQILCYLLYILVDKQLLMSINTYHELLTEGVFNKIFLGNKGKCQKVLDLIKADMKDYRQDIEWLIKEVDIETDLARLSRV